MRSKHSAQQKNSQRPAIPKKHLVLASVVTGLVGAVLLLPSEDVSAKRTELPLPLEFKEPTPPTPEAISQEEPEPWQTFQVANGDSLSTLFLKAGLGATELHNALSDDPNSKQFSRLHPGDKLHFLLTEDNRLQELRLEKSPLRSLVLRLEDGLYKVSEIERSTEKQTSFAHGTIRHSLFVAGEDAGLSQRLIMEMATIFGWDIDFALDIREGDSFSVVYEEEYIDGRKYRDGDILAARFTNQGRTYTALRYTDSQGNTSYYTPEGRSMRKAFLRTPVEFARISSHFNLKRRHPILHKIRAHKGTDYAAPRGTPIRSTGDGKIIKAGWGRGYGHHVVIRHGGNITTLYAHMKGFAKRIKSGRYVKQGQVIGYVGSSGLATGPHLHYEFRVNGAPKDPVRVKLPQAEPVKRSERARFEQTARTLMAQLDVYEENVLLAQRP